MDLENWISQLRKGTLEFAIMLLLEESPKYGLELIQTLEEIPGLVTKEGTVYPLLNRLKNDGLLEAEWVESPEGPPRKYYRLTRKGRQQLAEMRRYWHTLARSLDALVEGVRV
ncbi:MAG: PadR family transcriptional regulator [Candidatus Bipolaricaulota bacterium]|nr:PadR family transcriptional regulator [Candidatus Bipolaricaulota bacterium]MDW8030688.1 PadR family transcriptional regulator [Candidatus Bipolaricaulota bacterium]